jgi:hypothetical protein
VEFESPYSVAASPPGSCPRGGGHRGSASPLSELGAVAAGWGSVVFSPAVPPACHKRLYATKRGERLPALRSGESAT